MTVINVSPSVKAVRLDHLPPEAWTTLVGQPADAGDVAKIYAAVSWLYRGVQIRAAAVAAHPWELKRLDGDEVVTHSGRIEPPDDLPWLEALPFLNSLVEQAVVMRGRAYLAATVNGSGLITDIRHFLPDSIRTQYKEDGSLSHFERRRDGRATQHDPVDMATRQGDAVVYFWPPDFATEIGPAVNYPGKAALEAAGVVWSMDRFLSGYFDRGLVKATLLTYKQLPSSQDERERVKEWWRRVATGIKNAFATEVVSGEFEPIVIGEGLKDLGNQTLTTEKREDIAAALGIPQTKMASKPGGLGDVTDSDEIMFQTDTVIPECKWLAMVWNRQVFNPRGYQLIFRPDKLEIFQKSELDKALQIARLVGQPIMTVNEGREKLEMEPLDEASTVPIEDFANEEPAGVPETDNEINEAAEERKAAELARLKRFLSNGHERPFSSDILPAHVIEAERQAWAEAERQAAFTEALARYNELSDEQSGDGATD